MTVNILKAINTISPVTETHYAYQTVINEGLYPQAHDFYEIVLMIEGEMGVELCGQTFIAQPGNLILIRPGDIHSKKQTGASSHINLAFPAAAMEHLFEYLYDKALYERLKNAPFIPTVELNVENRALLAQRFEKLNVISPYEISKTKSHLRILLAHVMSEYFISAIDHAVSTNSGTTMPYWFQDTLIQLEKIDNLAKGMQFLIEYTDKTPEHISRTFRKILSTTPSNYINALRLNYVANMLTHSDHEIINLIYEAGFQSVNYFYRLFKKTFLTSPLKFRNKSSRTLLD